MAVNFRRVAKWSSAISVLLLITFMAILPGAVEKMEPMLDPEQQNVARLEARESSSVDFVDGHVYVALRVNDGENDPAAELRLLFDDENQEFSGDSPTRLHVERLVNGTSYAPVSSSEDKSAKSDNFNIFCSPRVTNIPGVSPL